MSVIRKWKRKKSFKMKNMEKSKLHYLEEFHITRRVIKLPIAVNLPLKYKATMNLKENKKFSK